jgi:hypothetical protein
MDADTLQQAVEELGGYIRRDVAAGFSDPDHIAESAVEVLSGEHDAEALRPHALRLTREAIEAHRREQATWPAVTDCDRLDAAFVELERSGIVARQNFTCCQTCGHYEIGDEITAAREAGREVRGYTFYHMQDTESAVEGGGLCLAYGALEPGDGALVAVGREIVKVLCRHDLKPEWDGSGAKRIFVSLDWKRRRAP